jgi:hypothetical protein
MKNSILILFILISFSSFNLKAQEEHESGLPSRHLEHKNDLVGFFGATYIFNSGFVLPTFGLEYVRKLNNHIGIGVISEFEVGSHIITYNENTENEMEVDRESATLLLPAIYFRAGEFVASIGYGVELEKSKNLGLLKVSLSYMLPLKKEYWYIIPNMSWDHTSEFNGLVYGFSVARSF